MNRLYYSRIYLNTNPLSLDMSLLDTQEWLSDETGHDKKLISLLPQPHAISFAANESRVLTDTLLSLKNVGWLRINARIAAPGHLWQSQLTAELHKGDSVKRTSVRLFNPVGEQTGEYAFYMQVPEYFRDSRLKVSISSGFAFEGRAEKLEVTLEQRKAVQLNQ